MIQATIQHKDYGNGLLLQGVQLRLDSAQRYGLLGPNGCGKSTLLRILAGYDGDFSGSVTADPDLRVALVAQEADFQADTEVIAWLSRAALGLRDSIRAVEAAMADPGQVANIDRLLVRYQSLLDAYHAAGGDEAEERALTVLNRLGMDHVAFTPVGALSGGEQGRIRVAAALEQRPGVLLLDEPGNHLDLWGLAWLEQQLEAFRGTLLMVSHDRRLLERLCNRTLSLYGSGLEQFAGSYGAWRIDRIQRAAGQGMRWQADRRHIERLEVVVRRYEEIARNTADPAWGARLRAKRSQLAQKKAGATQRPVLNKAPVDIQFQTQQSGSHTALELRGHCVERGGRVLVDQADLFVAVGQRVALAGRNGSGKTSLIDDILNLGHWEHPTIRVGPAQNIACIAQTRRGYDLDQCVVDHFLRLSACRREEAISFLRPYRFFAADLDKTLGQLSGGQWNLFQIARAVRSGANFLILDEPTNHLDLDARENLEQALEDFAGTLLVVSHDRWFLDAVCRRVVEIRDGRLCDDGLSPSEFLEAVRQEAADRSDFFAGTELEAQRRTQERTAEHAIKRGRWQDARRLGKSMSRDRRRIGR